VYSYSDSSISSGFLRFFKLFLWLLCLGFQALERRRRDWSLHFTVSMRGTFLSLWTLFFKSQQWRCSKMGSESGVQISLWSNVWWVQECSFTKTGFGSLREKRKLQCDGYLCHLRHCFTNSNGENVWKWVPNMVLKFYKYAAINESEIAILMRQFWVYAGKERILGEEEGKTNMRRRRSVKTYRQSKNWPNVSLFMARVLSAYYLLYFFIFINKNSILFHIKWINKISFLFSFKSLF